MRIAVVIGHEKGRPGAYSGYLQQTEFAYNSRVAPYFAEIDADIYFRPEGGGYKTQMRKLAQEINAINYDLVIELHFNSFNRKASGCEVLTYKGNNYTQLLGERICRSISTEYRTENRGVKQIDSEEDRGYWFLHYMRANAMILEPFFGDHEEALKFENPGKYAEVVKKALCG